MKHTLFALFPDREHAELVIRELLDSARCAPEDLTVVVHEDVGPEGLEATVQHSATSAESEGTRGAVRGALLGGLLGATLLGPFGLLGAGSIASVLFGAMTGSIPGAFAGGLAGLGFTDRDLRGLAKRLQQGDTLVTIRAPDRSAEQRIEALLEARGAEVAAKHLI